MFQNKVDYKCDPNEKTCASYYSPSETEGSKIKLSKEYGNEEDK